MFNTGVAGTLELGAGSTLNAVNLHQEYLLPPNTTFVGAGNLGEDQRAHHHHRRGDDQQHVGGLRPQGRRQRWRWRD